MTNVKSKTEADGPPSKDGKTWVYNVKPHTMAKDQDFTAAAILACLDFAHVFPRNRQGSFFATSDGIAVHLCAVPKESKATGRTSSVDASNSKSKEMEESELDKWRKKHDEQLTAWKESVEQRLLDAKSRDPVDDAELQALLKELESVFVWHGGLDCGKSGLDAVIPPASVQLATASKAAAEAAVSRAEALILEVEAELKSLLGDPQFGEERRQILEKHKGGDLLSEMWEVEDPKGFFDVCAAYDLLLLAKGQNSDALAELKRVTMDQEQAAKLFASDRHKGLSITKSHRKKEMHEQELQDERERRLRLFDSCLRGNDSHGTLLEKRASLHGIPLTDEEALLSAVKSRLFSFYLLQVCYNSSDQRKQRRTTDIRRRNYVSRVTRAVTKDLVEAVMKSPDGTFLSRNITVPKRSPHARQREYVRGWERGARVAAAAVQESNVALGARPLVPLCIWVDMFSGKGQRTSSSFPFQELFRSIVRHIKSRPALSGRVLVQVENGYRSSRQAAGALCYLSNAEQIDHRSVKITDLKNNWAGPLLDSFGYFFCPVTGKILKRDPPAALSMATIGTCVYNGAPRHNIWCARRTPAD